MFKVFLSPLTFFVSFSSFSFSVSSYPLPFAFPSVALGGAPLSATLDRGTK